MSHRTYDDTRRAWQRIWAEADLPAEHRTGDYARARAIRDRYLPAIPPETRVLEAGCGLGTELVALSARGRAAIGVDYALPALQTLKRAAPDTRLVAADIHTLPFRDGTFGAYLSFGVLEHFDFGPARALREAHRVLCERGTLVVTVPAPSLVWRLARWRKRWRAGEQDGAYFETTYTARALSHLVREAGFEVALVESVGHAFTLWGLGGPFRGTGHYETTRLADRLGRWLARALPEAMAFATLIVATRRPARM